MRLPLMFDAMISKGRLGPERFVELTATGPAHLFGLSRKGRIAPGMDGDLVLWDPEREVVLSETQDGTGYNPWRGRTVRGWPQTVLRRGEIVMSEGRLHAAPGSGRWVPMDRSPAMEPVPGVYPSIDA